MAIITNLVAINDIAHGKQVFRVHGTVTVASPAIEPVLVEPKLRHRGGWEVLELQLLDSGAITPQVLTEKNRGFRACRRHWLENRGDHSCRRFAALRNSYHRGD
ncbi:hypothetical protein PPS11_36385 [Pseudomonas putida S11]|nr:hypothetical protein PPS11_36385 [Pseudomonas putida S11]